MSSTPSAVAKRRLSKSSPTSKTVKLDESAALPSILRALRELEEKVQRQSDKLESLFDSISSKITEVERALCKKIDTEVAVLSSKVIESAERIAALEAKQMSFETEVQRLKAEINKAANNKFAPDITADAIAFGIPYTEGENLKSIFNGVCLSIDFLVPQVRDIFRAKPSNNNPNSAVVIKFYTPLDRNRTLRAFSDYRKRTKSIISLTAVGLEGKFSIFESLATDTRKILQEAISLRREGKLASVFTLRGVVYVKVDKNSTALRIDARADLHKFC